MCSNVQTEKSISTTDIEEGYMKPLLTIGFHLLMLPVLAHGATYHVAKSGSDSYTCAQAQSASTPKLTVNGGLRCLSGRDTLIIWNGTYYENIASGSIPSGTSSAKTIIKAASGQIVRIRPSDGLFVLHVQSRSHITFDGLIFDGMNVSNQNIRVSDGSHFIRIQNSTVENGGNACIGSAGESVSSSNIQIVNNVIRNCGTTDGHHLVYLRTTENLVEGNRISGAFVSSAAGAYGVRFDMSQCCSSDNNIVRYNAIFNNASRGINVGGGTGTKVYNNLIYNNDRAADSVGGIFVGNGGVSAAEIYNNTIYGNKEYCIFIRDNTNHVVRNNICWQNTKNSIRNDPGGSTISNNLFTDPLFVDAGNANFTLQADSPAIDRGVTIPEISTDFVGVPRGQGAACDIGAYEYVYVSNPPARPSDLNVVTGN